MIERLVEWALKYKIPILIIFVAICILGSWALFSLPIDAFPDISPNLVQVFGEVDGMAAEEIEQLVSRPIEVAMMGLPGVKTVRSSSVFGLATVNIYFNDDVNIYRAHELVNQKLSAAEAAMPKNLDLHHGIEKGPIISGMGKVLSYYIESDRHTTTELRTFQDWIVKRNLQTVPGVGDVISQGGFVRQYQIRLLPHKLLQYDITIEDVHTAIQNNNQNLGANFIVRGDEEIIVRSLGLIKNLDDIRNIPLRTHNGTPVFVKDVANVEFGKGIRRGFATLNGEKEVAAGNVYKIHKANSFEVINRLKKRIEEINQQLPEGAQVVVFYDQSFLVSNTINTIKYSLGIGLILVCLVAFVFLGDIRNSFILVFSLPFSIFITFSVMKNYGMSGDLISFGGIAIALGMIIDATIIMVEKIQAALQRDSGKRPMTEVIVATAKEIGPPIFFAIVIIIIVFIPIITLQEVEGKMFRPLGITVSVTMLGSLIYALVVAPVLYSILHRGKSGKKVIKDRLTIFHKGYRDILSIFLNKRILVTGLIIIGLGTGVWLFTRLGTEFVPILQEGDLQVLAHLNPNISLDKAKDIAMDLEREIIKSPEVEQALSDVGYGEVSPHIHQTNYACITVGLKPMRDWTPGKSREDLENEIRDRIKGYPGITVEISLPIKHEIDHMITGASGQVVAKLFGPDLEVLKNKAVEIENSLKTVRGAADVFTDPIAGQTQLNIELNLLELGRHGLDKLTVQHTIHDAIGGEILSEVFEGDKRFGIFVRYDESFRNSIESINSLLIKKPDGSTILLSDLLKNKIVPITGYRQISRENSHRLLPVRCNVTGRDLGSFVADAKKLIAEQVDLAPEYYIVWGGQFELQQAANRRLSIIIPITLLAVLLMLFSLFHSMKNVLLIMLNIPLALVGGVIALFIFGGILSIPSSIGFIALFGIALTDGLVLISRFEYLRKKGMALKEAVIEGSLSKLRPVLMTTITTAFGLLPLIISTGVGSEIQRPLAIVVVGGLVSSTLLTLIVLPSLYLSFSRENEK
ncbi:MAG: efflux RND transporter permease subunit [Deltaproteobacteria bacterium]|nr:efflux RND transporter permease subunit [Deltaproteobacteria bacterium]